jgi:transposase
VQPPVEAFRPAAEVEAPPGIDNLEAWPGWLVPDTLWDIVKPLLPEFSPRPQGGGTSPVDERAVFTAVVFVLTSGCAWRHLPPSFGVSVPTAHRRFMVWADTGVFGALHR